MIDILKMAFKIMFFSLLLGLLGSFLNYLISLIVPLNLKGCMGHYADLFGIVDSFRLFLSILVYGFTAKFAFTYYKNYLN